MVVAWLYTLQLHCLILSSKRGNLSIYHAFIKKLSEKLVQKTYFCTVCSFF